MLSENAGTVRENVETVRKLDERTKSVIASGRVESARRVGKIGHQSARGRAAMFGRQKTGSGNPERGR
jgi:hypothetical protein